MAIIFSDDEIQEFNWYARGTIEEYYLLLKRAVTPRAATKMKKSMTQRMGDRLDGRMSLEDNKALFHAIIESCCAASIAAQVHFSNKAFRAKLSKEALLEKCRICKIDEQVTYQILKAAGFDYPKPMDMLIHELHYTKDYAAQLEKTLEWKRSRLCQHPDDRQWMNSIRFDERDLEKHREQIRKLEAELASRNGEVHHEEPRKKICQSQL